VVFTIFSEALLTGQVFSGEGGWLVEEREDRVPPPFLQSLVRLQLSGALFQDKSSILFPWHLSSVINLSSVGHA